MEMMTEPIFRYLAKIFTANIHVRGTTRFVELYYRFRTKDFVSPGTEKIGSFLMNLSLDDRLQRHIYFGIYERDETKCLKSMIQNGAVVFDIGANIGYYTLLLKSLVGITGKVHSFEPVPSNFAKLAKAVEINNLTNVFLNQVAVSDASGNAILYTAGVAGECGWASIVQPSRGEFFEVRAISIDDYVAAHSIDRIDLVKIDVEGAEMRVLNGMAKLLANRKVDNIFIEINEVMLRAACTSGEAIHSKLLRDGYKAFHVRDHRQCHPIYSLSGRDRKLQNLLYRI
jgi:FkbM family methyltransferase